MNDVVTARWVRPGWLLILLLWGVNVSSQSLVEVHAAPDAGFHIAAVFNDNGMTDVKRHKLEENLKHAAEDYRAGRFDHAVAWYRGALQLASERPDIQELLSNAQSMLETQQRQIELLPDEPRERARVLEEVYDSGVKSYREGQYGQAREVFHKLWVTVGDFKGKTLSMYRKTERKLAGLEAISRDDVTGHHAGVPLNLLAGEPGAMPGAVRQDILVDSKWLEQEIVKARAAIQTGYYDDARRILNAVLRHQSGHPDALQALSYLDNQQRRVEAASNRGGVEIVQAVGAEVGPVITSSSSLYHEATHPVAPKEIEETRSSLHDAVKILPDHKSFPVMLAQSDEAGDVVADTSGLPAGEGSGGDGDNSGMKSPRSGEVEAVAVEEDVEVGRRIEFMHEEAVGRLDDGDVRGARSIWERILELDPENDLASTYLANTTDSLRDLESSEARDAQAAGLFEEGQVLLNSPISISTDRKIPLEDFMNAISFATPIELQYYIAEGAEADIYANFVDKPLSDVLDTVLVPIGIRWSKDDRNVITIKPALFSKTYSLSAVQISKLRELMDSGTLQKIIWNQLKPPSKGVEIILNERQNVLIVTGSKMHLDKIESFLPSVEIAETPDLVMKIYKIREEDGPRIKSLINNIIRSSGETIFALERKVLIDGDDLIVRDIPENITKIEELLLDQNFISSLREETLNIENFSLVPKDVENVQSDQITVFTARVVEAIKVFLYAQEGERRAAEAGRRLWFDEATLQLTIVDTPSNLERVREYIDSLPELGEQVHQKVIFLKYQESQELGSDLERILDISTGSSGGGVGGQEVFIKLRRGDERQIFNNIRLRILRVEDNDEEDRNDDTVEISISIPGLGPQNTTLQELDSQLIDDYEFIAEDVLPSAGLPGEGSARIRVRAVTTDIDSQSFAEDSADEDAVQLTEDRGISITPFGDLNALIIRYTDPAIYQDVLDLLDQLDIPTPQVSIETKFVTVNETRAKEFSAEFDILGLGHDRDVDWTNTLVNTNFADNASEFRDPFSPPIENLLNSNLIKGTTILDAVIGTIPNIQYQLRLLEAEGILNLVNGPKVLALNGEEAEFRIESTARDTDDEEINDLVEVINPFEDLEGIVADTDEATEDELVEAVILRVTPSITSEDSIILRELSAEIIDFEGFMAEGLIPQVEDVDDITENTFFLPVVPDVAVGTSFNMVQKRKKIVTDARIKNGGTIIIGGWTGERTQELTSGVPVLRNLPYFGRLLFSRNQRTKDRTTLLIFLTGHLVD